MKSIRILNSLFACLFLAACFCGSAVRAGEGAFGESSPAMLWDSFTSHLRKGEMKAAYNCFTPTSQHYFSYRDFCTHYNPLTAASEATLSPSDDKGQFSFSGDIARLRYLSTTQSPSSVENGEDLEQIASDTESMRQPAGVFVTAFMVRENGMWHLVSAASEPIELAEAEARNLLRRLWRAQGIVDAVKAGKALDETAIQQAAPAVFRASEVAFSLSAYDLKLENSDSGMALSAISQRKQLRSFVVDGNNEVKARTAGFDMTMPEPRKTEGKAEKRSPLPPPPPDMGDPAAAKVTPEDGAARDAGKPEPDAMKARNVELDELPLPPSIGEEDVDPREASHKDEVMNTVPAPVTGPVVPQVNAVVTTPERKAEVIEKSEPEEQKADAALPPPPPDMGDPASLPGLPVEAAEPRRDAADAATEVEVPAVDEFKLPPKNPIGEDKKEEANKPEPAPLKDQVAPINPPPLPPLPLTTGEDVAPQKSDMVGEEKEKSDGRIVSPFRKKEDAKNEGKGDELDLLPPGIIDESEL
ncbi:MAG: hypothetical protein JXR97_00665 [Planctomycetes bacterium]|nr:hypothetical protein [Planctomycetota bacterium]